MVSTRRFEDGGAEIDLLTHLFLPAIAVDRWYQSSSEYGLLVAGLILGHLVLDLIERELVPLFYSLIEQGFGLQYLVRTVFGRGSVGVLLEGPVASVRSAVPRGGYNICGFINGGGFGSLLAFARFYVGAYVQGGVPFSRRAMLGGETA